MLVIVASYDLVHDMNSFRWAVGPRPAIRSHSWELIPVYQNGCAVTLGNESPIEIPCMTLSKRFALSRGRRLQPAQTSVR